MPAALCGSNNSAALGSGTGGNFGAAIGQFTSDSATESNVARVARIAGTFSNYGCSIDASGTARSITWRKTAANANGTLSFTDSAAVIVYDNVHTDHYAATDSFDVQVAFATGTPTIRWCKQVFTADSGHAAYYAAGNNGQALSGGTVFIGLSAAVMNLNTESTQRIVMRAPGTWRSLALYVTANSTAGTMTMTSRKNGGAGNQTVSVASNTTGVFEDTTNSDTFVSGDTLDWAVSGQSNALVTLGAAGVASIIVFSGNTNEVIAGGNGAAVTATVANKYFSIVGASAAGAFNGTESILQIQHGFAAAASNLRTNVTQNTATQTTTLRTRINGVDGNQTLAIGPSVTGTFEDTTDTDSFGASDNVNYAMNSTAGVSGSLLFSYIAMTEQQSIPAVPYYPVNRWLFSPGRGPGRGLRSTSAYPPAVPVNPTTASLTAVFLGASFGTPILLGSVPISASGKDAATALARQTAKVNLGAASLGALSGRNNFSAFIAQLRALTREQLTSRAFAALTTPIKAATKGLATVRAALAAMSVAIQATSKGISSGRAPSPLAIVLTALTRGQAVARASFSALTTPITATAKGLASARAALTSSVALSGRTRAQGLGRAPSPLNIVFATFTRGAAFARAIATGSLPLSAREFGQATGKPAPGGSVGLAARSVSALKSLVTITVAGTAKVFLQALGLSTSRGSLRSAGQLALRASARLSLFGRLARFLVSQLFVDPRLIAAPNVAIASRAGSRRTLASTPAVRPVCSPLPFRGSGFRTSVIAPVVIPWTPTMPYGNDLSPVDPSERVTLTFNFAPWLASGETIISVSSITVANAGESQVQDPNPQNIVIAGGGSQIGNVPGQPANTAVLQQATQCQPNVTYLLQCLVQTSANQLLNLMTHLPCNAPE